MILTQALLDEAALLTQTLLGERQEPITYHARSNLSDTATSHAGLVGLMSGYSDAVILTHLSLMTSDRDRVLREDVLMRLATSAVSWLPTTADTVTRADSTIWRVMAISHGPGRPFYHMRLRKIG